VRVVCANVLYFLDALRRITAILQWLNGTGGEGTEKVGEKMAAAGFFEEVYI